MTLFITTLPRRRTSDWTAFRLHSNRPPRAVQRNRRSCLELRSGLELQGGTRQRALSSCKPRAWSWIARQTACPPDAGQARIAHAARRITASDGEGGLGPIGSREHGESLPGQQPRRKPLEQEREQQRPRHAVQLGIPDSVRTAARAIVQLDPQSVRRVARRRDGPEYFIVAVETAGAHSLIEPVQVSAARSVAERLPVFSVVERVVQHERAANISQQETPAMPFGLADPNVMVQHCVLFDEILKKYKIEKTLAEGRKRTIIESDRFADFAVEICKIFANHFQRHYHPEPKLAFQNLGTGGTMANFQPDLWQVTLNMALVVSERDFPIKFAPVIFRSIYHEYRHGEQFALIIRYLWAQDPAWLRYENMTYNAERNQGVPAEAQVSPPALKEAYEEWELAVQKMSDGAIEAKIAQSLNTVGGARVSSQAVRSLAKLPLSRLAGCPQDVIDQAARWFQSRFRTSHEVYGGRDNIWDSARMFEEDETTAANIESADAKLYADVIDRELKQWNGAKPTGFPSWPISLKLKEGQDLLKLRDRGFDESVIKACHKYLTARRAAAIELISASQGWYEGVPLEADTHALERDIAKILVFSEKTADSVAKSAGVIKDQYLPHPKDWSL